MKKKKISYRPIKGQCKGSYTALTIYPPGTWFENTKYVVFVGGCGLGEAPTLKEAEKLLLEKAKECCIRNIEEAKRMERHYRKELGKLWCSPKLRRLKK